MVSVDVNTDNVTPYPLRGRHRKLLILLIGVLFIGCSNDAGNAVQANGYCGRPQRGKGDVVIETFKHADLTDLSPRSILKLRESMAASLEPYLEQGYSPREEVFSALSTSQPWEYVAGSSISLVGFAVANPALLVFPRRVECDTGVTLGGNRILRVSLAPTRKKLTVTWSPSRHSSVGEVCLDLWLQNALDFGFKSGRLRKSDGIAASDTDFSRSPILDRFAFHKGKNSLDTFSSRWKKLRSASLEAFIEFELFCERDGDTGEPDLVVRIEELVGAYPSG